MLGFLRGWLIHYAAEDVAATAVAEFVDWGTNNMLFLGNRFPGRNSACAPTKKPAPIHFGAVKCLNYDFLPP